jgi:hypothetical protein
VKRPVASRADEVLLEHTGSILLPGDEVVLSIFRADGETTIRWANERADLPLDRVTPVTAYGLG